MKLFKSKIKNIQAILIISLVLPLCAFGQSSDLGNWMIYIGDKKLEKGFNIHNEIQYRNYNGIGDLEQLLLRTGIGYDLTENNNNILLGYGYILSENYIDRTHNKVTLEEHRIFQQFTTKQNIGNVGLSHRYRVEERFFERDFKMRFRYFFGLKLPLQVKESNENLIYLSAYNEVFLNAEAAVFDRNRTYGGVGYQLTKDLRFEVGYMNQFLEQSGRDQLNVIAYATF